MSNKINALSIKNEGVRKTISLSNGEKIFIYNPTQEIIKQFLEFQKNYFVENMNNEGFDARTVLIDLIPMFTNLDFSEVSDELIIQDFINNPSLELQEIKEELKVVINKINYINTMDVKNQFDDVDLKVKQIKIVNSIPIETFETLNGTDELITDKTINNFKNIVELNEKMNIKTEEEVKLQKEIEDTERILNELKQRQLKNE